MRCLPPTATRTLPRNHAFRHIEAGSAVLPAMVPLGRLRTLYVIHNDVLRRGDGRAYATKLARRLVARPGDASRGAVLVLGGRGQERRVGVLVLASHGDGRVCGAPAAAARRVARAGAPAPSEVGS